MSLQSTSRALGNFIAKSGMTIAGDLMREENLLLGKTDAGYMSAKSGRQLAWAVYVNDVLSADLLDLIGVGADIGTIAEAIYEMHSLTGNPPGSWAMLRGT